MDYLLLIVGFIIIVKASDILIDATSSLAHRMKIPKILIALTVVAFGTCAPEFAISFNSIASNNASLALANVIGSIIVNTFLVIGISAVVNPIVVKNSTIKKELPILTFITLAFVCMSLDKIFNNTKANILTRSDGIVLLILFSIFMIYIVRMVRRSKKDNEDIKNESKIKVAVSIIKAIILTVFSIVLVIYSSNLIVDSALRIAKSLNVSEKIVTLIGIVIGTSLPELVMTITSAKKSEFEMAIGNIIGTNIFNICVVLGLPIAICGKLEIVDFNYIDMIFVFLSSFLLYVFARSEKKVNKIEGIIMLLLFISYYAYALFIG